MSRRAASAVLMSARAAVGRSVEDLPDGSVVLVGCSGGPDSLALVGCAAWVGERQGHSVRAVIVDHGLQQGSAGVASGAAAACAALGVPSDIVRVEVGTAGGPEAAARDARYAALEQAAETSGASAVLLGHTLDDQAETVLLRLARGSGARTLAAMSARAGRWRRPFLSMPRTDVHAAAVGQQVGQAVAAQRVVNDQHNAGGGHQRDSMALGRSAADNRQGKASFTRVPPPGRAPAGPGSSRPP